MEREQRAQDAREPGVRVRGFNRMELAAVVLLCCLWTARWHSRRPPRLRWWLHPRPSPSRDRCYPSGCKRNGNICDVVLLVSLCRGVLLVGEISYSLWSAQLHYYQRIQQLIIV